MIEFASFLIDLSIFKTFVLNPLFDSILPLALS